MYLRSQSWWQSSIIPISEAVARENQPIVIVFLPRLQSCKMIWCLSKPRRLRGMASLAGVLRGIKAKKRHLRIEQDPRCRMQKEKKARGSSSWTECHCL
jgi:hypothetical protein